MPKRTKVKFILAAAGLFLTQLPVSAESCQVQVTAVIDGDTLFVSHDGKKEKVIMYGIDCPELGQFGGEEAKQFTNACCYHKDVTLDIHGHDKFNRLVAVVLLSDGANLNQELVKRGLAWWSDKFAPDDAALKRLHSEAKNAKVGLWAAPNPVPPWIFRNGDKSVQATIRPAQ
jgi:micrococcal nuclease